MEKVNYKEIVRLSNEIYNKTIVQKENYILTWLTKEEIIKVQNFLDNYEKE